MKCGRADCARSGTHYLVAKVWARGYPKSSTPISSVIGMQFCKDHAHDEAKSQELIGDEFWDVVDAMTRNRAPVDRASLELVPTRGDVGQAIDGLRARN